MKITIDTAQKSIIVEDPTPLCELLDYLKANVKGWKDHTLQTKVEWTQPYVPYIPYYPYSDWHTGSPWEWGGSFTVNVQGAPFMLNEPQLLTD